MNAISYRCRSFNRGYNRVFIIILKVDTHLVVGSAGSAGDVATSHSLAAAAFKIIYTVAEFSNEFENEDQEFHDVYNVFNAKMQSVAERKYINITE